MKLHHLASPLRGSLGGSLNSQLQGGEREPRAHPGHGLGPAGGFSWHGRAPGTEPGFTHGQREQRNITGKSECSMSVNELHCTEIGWEVKISI